MSSEIRVREAIHDWRFMNVIPFTAFISRAALETVAPRKNITGKRRTQRDEWQGYGYVDNE
jgi:hypothetical protein